MKAYWKPLLTTLCVLALTVLACNNSLWPIKPLTLTPVIASNTPFIASPSPLPPTNTPVVVPPTPTAKTVALPVVSAPDIVHITMLTAADGWAVGSVYVLRTHDGGVTWMNATPSGVTSVGFSAIATFRDASAAWVLLPSSEGTSGTLYRTGDGGVTWTSSMVPFSGGSLQFLDTQNGWMLAALGAAAGSEAVAVYQTADGGANWTRVYVNDPTVPGSSDSLPLAGQKSGMTFLDTAHGWVGGSEPMDGFLYLYTSVDHGHTWMHQEAALPTGFETAQTVVDAPRFFSTVDGILPVRLYLGTSATVFYVTHDGGLTWTPTFPINLAGHTSTASLTDVFIWDGGPALFASHDSGLTWSQIKPNINVIDTLMQFQFVDAHTGWMLTGDASDHHSLFKTTDGGATWTAEIP